MKTNLKKLKQTKKLLQYLPEYNWCNRCQNKKKVAVILATIPKNAAILAKIQKKVVAILATIQAAVAENKSPAMESQPVKRKIQQYKDP